MRTLRIGTRGSDLALYQARAVAALLGDRAGGAAEIAVIRTSGDRLAEAPLSAAGGKRLFVKEIEDALLAGEVDLAVHSSKDLPAALPDGLAIAAALPREDARDALVLPPGAEVAGGTIDSLVRALGGAPRIGTSSVRRTAQLARLFTTARFLPIRGNLDTRLRKLDEGHFDAIVLAAAGLRRLGRADRITAVLPIDACIPAPGQGIIAVEIRDDDERVRSAVARIGDAAAGAQLAAERAVVERLGGGCQMPIGAFAHAEGDAMIVTAIVLSSDGARAVRATGRGAASSPETAGRAAADELIRDGAGGMLDEVRRAQAAAEQGRS